MRLGTPRTGEGSAPLDHTSSVTCQRVMPAASTHMVSVFHFSSNISSAKIRKYKIATEKGMGSATPTPGDDTATPSPALKPAKMDPPKKRIKLTNGKAPRKNARPAPEDTIAVSRPKRAATMKKRKSEEMEEDGLSSASAIDVSRASTADSSLSSLSSVQALDEPPPPIVQTTKPVKARGYSTDFMSFYVDDAVEDDVEEVVEVAPPKPALPPKAVAPPKPTQNPPPVSAPGLVPPPHAATPAVQQPANTQPTLGRPPTKFKHSTGPPPPYQAAPRQPPRQPARQPARPRPGQQTMVYPTVQLIDSYRRRIPTEPATVATMVAKLEHLLQTLDQFAGLSLASRPPIPEPLCLQSEAPVVAGPSTAPLPDKPSPPLATDGDPAVSGLLDAIDVDDDDDEEDDDEDETTGSENQTNHTTPPTNSLDYVLKHQGKIDDALVCGIQFIQNALAMWAQQRLTQQYSEFYFYEQYRISQMNPKPRRGPGRPRKFDSGEEYTQMPAPHITMDLARTNEGMAIAAFQEVLDCGCLLVNTILPAELSRPLGRLYWQMDQLVNQRSKPPPVEWVCRSYLAQQEAHRRMVGLWKENQAKMEVELQNQRDGIYKPMYRPMGPPGGLTHEQIRQAHAVAERNLNMQQGISLPHPSAYNANVWQPPQPTHLNGTAAPSSSLAQKGAATSSKHPPVSHDRPSISNSISISSSSPLIGNGVHPNSSSPVSNLFSRSGASMKLSFPTNVPTVATNAFLPQTFPGKGKGKASAEQPSKPSTTEKTFGPNVVGTPPTGEEMHHQYTLPTAPSEMAQRAPSPDDEIRVATRPSSAQTTAPKTSNFTAVNGVAGSTKDASTSGAGTKSKAPAVGGSGPSTMVAAALDTVAGAANGGGTVARQ